MNEPDHEHRGLTAQGEDFVDLGYPATDEHAEAEPQDADAEERITDCTILYWNGEYQKPNVTITGGKIAVRLGAQVSKIQMRHVDSGGIRFYKGGTHRIPNGVYVLSLWGHTYRRKFIKACITYT